MNDIERRLFAVDELRAERADGQPTRLRGHAAVFNVLSQDLGGFREMILPGAFLPSAKEDDIRALFNHNPDNVLGRSVAKTLRMDEDSVGLGIEIDLPETQLARDLAVSIERGDISQMSFAFRVKPGGSEWAETDQGIVRTLKSVRLYDVSPVTYPAYLQTDVAARALDGFRSEREQKLSAQSMHAVREIHLRAIRLGA
jgi:HK97 family phage prohead protease